MKTLKNNNKSTSLDKLVISLVLLTCLCAITAVFAVGAQYRDLEIISVIGLCVGFIGSLVLATIQDAL